jgi:hypothetical protein
MRTTEGHGAARPDRPVQATMWAYTGRDDVPIHPNHGPPNRPIALSAKRTTICLRGPPWFFVALRGKIFTCGQTLAPRLSARVGRQRDDTAQGAAATPALGEPTPRTPTTRQPATAPHKRNPPHGKTLQSHPALTACGTQPHRDRPHPTAPFELSQWRTCRPAVAPPCTDKNPRSDSGWSQT